MTRPIFISIIIAVILSLDGCTPPGKGRRANRGYKRSEPIIAALDEYHKITGEYPTNLMDLAPTYVSMNALEPPIQKEYPFEYKKIKDSYTLKFRYVGQGMNYCIYSPETGWDCRGYY